MSQIGQGSGGTANEMSITGNKTTVSRVSLKKLNAFRDKIVSSGNLFVYVTGNIGSDGEKLIKKVHKMHQRINAWTVDEKETAEIE